MSVIVKTICDKCGVEIAGEQGKSFVTIRLREADNTWSLDDLCLDCAMSLLKILKEHGYELKESESGW